MLFTRNIHLLQSPFQTSINYDANSRFRKFSHALYINILHFHPINHIENHPAQNLLTSTPPILTDTNHSISKLDEHIKSELLYVFSLNTAHKKATIKNGGF